MHPLQSHLRRYLWIDGRASRREWWTTMILVLMLGVQLDVTSVFARPLFGAGYGLDGIIRLALAALLFWIDVASTIRRLHDRGKSGWNGLPYLFPGFGWMWMVIECGILPSQKGANRYGPEPDTRGAERGRPGLQALLSAIDGKAGGPWSKPVAQPAKPAAARPLKHVQFQEGEAAAKPAMARAPARTQRRPVVQSVVQPGAVRRASPAGGKTALILAAAAIMGLLVATYVMSTIDTAIDTGTTGATSGE